MSFASLHRKVFVFKLLFALFCVRRAWKLQVHVIS